MRVKPLSNSNQSVNIVSAPTLDVDILSAPNLDVNVLTLPTGNVNVLSLPIADVNILTAPTLNTNVLSLPTGNVNVLTLPTGNVNILTAPTLNVDVLTLPIGNVNILSSSILDVTGEVDVNILTAPTLNVDVLSLPIADVNILSSSTLDVTGEIDVNILTGQVGIDQTIDGTTNKVRVTQPDHDDLNCNSNIQLDNIDISEDNPLPVSSKIYAGQVTEIFTDISISTLSGEIDCTGFNGIRIESTVSGTGDWDLEVYGCLTTGGTFGICNYPQDAGTQAPMTVTHDSDDVKIFQFKGIVDYVKINAVRTAGNLSCRVQPVVF